MICIRQRDIGRAVLEDKYFTTLKLIVPGVLKVNTKSMYTAQIHFAPIVVTDLYTYIYVNVIKKKLSVLVFYRFLSP